MDRNVTASVKYIGVDDLDLDLFESQYEIPEGVSYNSYVVFDKKIAIVDTVDARKSAEWLDNLSEVLVDKTPDYLIVQHLEPDHAGVIDEVMAKYPKMQIVASAKAIAMLPQFFGHNFANRTIAVKDKETLSLGSKTFTFLTAPMVHWPEVIVTYLDTEKILFSADGFGRFGALSIEQDWACEARRYYFNIVGKYGTPVQTLLKKVSVYDIQTICPLHGPILSENLGYYIGLYDTWSKYDVETEGVFIAYASIHGNTAKTAQRLAEILKEKGAPKVSITDLSRDDMAEAVEDAFRMRHLVLAASSYDGGVFTPMHTFLHILQVKAFQNRNVSIIENGSWAPCAAKEMKEMLSSMKNINLVGDVVTVKSVMSDATESQLNQLADAIMEANKDNFK